MNSNDKERRLATAFVVALLAVLVLVVLGSWGAASLGFRVESLLSDEALRWSFRQTGVATNALRGQLLLMSVVVAGAFWRSGFFAGGRRSSSACKAAAATLFVGLALVALLALLPASPLRSATGDLWPSPFLLGFLRAVAVVLLLSAAVYGGVSGRLRSWTDFVSLLYAGFQRFAPWLIVWFLSEMVVNLIRFSLFSLTP